MKDILNMCLILNYGKIIMVVSKALRNLVL